MYHAMAENRLDNLTGFIVGSMQPWVEVMALKHGETKIEIAKMNLRFQELNKF